MEWKKSPLIGFQRYQSSSDLKKNFGNQKKFGKVVAKKPLNLATYWRGFSTTSKRSWVWTSLFASWIWKTAKESMGRFSNRRTDETKRCRWEHHHIVRGRSSRFFIGDTDENIVISDEEELAEISLEADENIVAPSAEESKPLAEDISNEQPRNIGRTVWFVLGTLGKKKKEVIFATKREGKGSRLRQVPQGTLRSPRTGGGQVGYRLSLRGEKNIESTQGKENARYLSPKISRPSLNWKSKIHIE